MTRSRAVVLLRQTVLVAVAAVPALLMLLLLHHDLRADRQAQLAARLRLHAALLDADLAAVVQAGRQVGQTILRLPAVRTLSPACGADLQALLGRLPAYTALSVVNAAGAVVCAAPASGAAPAPVARRLAAATGRVAVGVFAPALPGQRPSLPLALPFPDPGAKPGGPPATLVLSLGLDWLGAHLAGQSAADPARDGAVEITDANGIILARAPDGPAFIGQRAAPALAARLSADATAPILSEIVGMDGRTRLTAISPAAGGRLFVAAGLPPPGLLAGADRLGWRGGVAIAGGVLLSLWLLLLLSARMERRPAAALLDAARRWSAGDLGARARLDRAPDSEFGRLATAFNTMAEALGRQRAELLDLNTTLEARVAERTRDLVASRNQLQLQVVEREKAEIELRQAQKLQAVGLLAGGIAHDFNNLLASVTSALDLLRRRLGASEIAVSRPLDTALQAARRGARLTAQLLAFSRRQRLLPAATDLNRLIGELPALVAGLLGRDIVIRTRPAADLWPALVDPGQLEAALLNLVFNARDAMPAGGILTLSTANVMLPQDLPTGPTLAPGAYVAIRVADTGAGMPPEVLGRVFEPFFTTKPAGSASGLGLSQVHGLALQSGGDVRIDSRPDAGTTVTLLLPRAAVPPEPAPRPAAPRSLHILVTDDDDAVRHMTGEILIERGHHPVLAADATQALAILEKDLADTGGSFDVLLSDYVMPGINGVALILMAQALQPRMRALLVTGHAEFAASERLRPEHIMRKPFTIAELDARLAALIAEPPGAPAAPTAPAEACGRGA